MEINGRNSCTGNFRHVNIRYIFVKDRVNKKELEIKYCPAHFMLADFHETLARQSFSSFQRRNNGIHKYRGFY